MGIKKITIDELRAMRDTKEGIVLGGCGEYLGVTVNAINDALTDQGVLLDGTRLTDCYTFEHNDQTYLFMSLEGAKLNLGKFAIWRLNTHEHFSGTWLSDFVDQLQDSPTPQKPNCPLIDQDSNIFNLMGIASRTLKQHGMAEQATEMCNRIFDCKSYHEALGIIGQYVNITFVNDPSDDDIDEDDIDEDETERMDTQQCF